MNRLVRYSTPVWNPASAWSSPMAIMEELLSSFSPYRGSGQLHDSWNETVHFENGEFKIRVVLPGFSRDQLQLCVEGDTLHLKLKDQNKDRRYKLPENVNIESISATLENGILSITVPTKTIPVTQIEIK